MRHFIKDPYTLIDEIWKDKDVLPFIFRLKLLRVNTN